MNSFTTPSVENLGQLLRRVLGADPVISPAEPYPAGEGFLANYIQEDAATKAICIADLGMVAFSGAAFLNTPASDARQVALTGELSSEIIESYTEIANILTRALCSEHSERLSLERVYAPGAAPDPLVQFSNTSSEPSSFYIEVPGFGTGALTFYTRFDA